MLRKDNHYYVGYGYDGDSIDYSDTVDGCVTNDFTDYETALKYAKIEHKAEIEYQREENGRNSLDELMTTYVMKTSPKYDDYVVAEINGWRSKVTEYEDEDEDEDE